MKPTVNNRYSTRKHFQLVAQKDSSEASSKQPTSDVAAFLDQRAHYRAAQRRNIMTRARDNDSIETDPFSWLATLNPEQVTNLSHDFGPGVQSVKSALQILHTHVHKTVPDAHKLDIDDALIELLSQVATSVAADGTPGVLFSALTNAYITSSIARTTGDVATSAALSLLGRDRGFDVTRVLMNYHALDRLPYPQPDPKLDSLAVTAPHPAPPTGTNGPTVRDSISTSRVSARRASVLAPGESRPTLSPTRVGPSESPSRKIQPLQSVSDATTPEGRREGGSTATGTVEGGDSASASQVATLLHHAARDAIASPSCTAFVVNAAGGVRRGSVMPGSAQSPLARAGSFRRSEVVGVGGDSRGGLEGGGGGVPSADCSVDGTAAVFWDLTKLEGGSGDGPDSSSGVNMQVPPRDVASAFQPSARSGRRSSFVAAVTDGSVDGTVCQSISTMPPVPNAGGEGGAVSAPAPTGGVTMSIHSADRSGAAGSFASSSLLHATADGRPPLPPRRASTIASLSASPKASGVGGENGGSTTATESVSKLVAIPSVAANGKGSFDRSASPTHGGDAPAPQVGGSATKGGGSVVPATSPGRPSSRRPSVQPPCTQSARRPNSPSSRDVDARAAPTAPTLVAPSDAPLPALDDNDAGAEALGAMRNLSGVYHWMKVDPSLRCLLATRFIPGAPLDILRAGSSGGSDATWHLAQSIPMQNDSSFVTCAAHCHGHRVLVACVNNGTFALYAGFRGEAFVFVKEVAMYQVVLSCEWQRTFDCLVVGSRTGALSVWRFGAAAKQALQLAVTDAPGQEGESNAASNPMAVLGHGATGGGAADARGSAANADSTAKKVFTCLGTATSTHVSGVTALLCLNDSSRVVSGSSDGSIVITQLPWGVKESSTVGHAAPITALAWCAEENLLISGDATGGVVCWAQSRFGALSGTEWTDLKLAHAGAIVGIFASPRGTQVVTCDSRGLSKVWDARAMAPIHAFTAPPHRPVSELSPNGSVATVASCASVPSTSHILFSTPRGIEVFEHDTVGSGAPRLAHDVGSGGMVNALYNTARNRFYTAAGCDVKIWSTRGHVHTYCMSIFPSPLVAFELDEFGDHMIGACSDDLVRIHDAGDGSLVATLAPSPHPRTLTAAHSGSLSPPSFAGLAAAPVGAAFEGLAKSVPPKGTGRSKFAKVFGGMAGGGDSSPPAGDTANRSTLSDSTTLATGAYEFGKDPLGAVTPQGILAVAHLVRLGLIAATYTNPPCVVFWRQPFANSLGGGGGVGTATTSPLRTNRHEGAVRSANANVPRDYAFRLPSPSSVLCAAVHLNGILVAPAGDNNGPQMNENGGGGVGRRKSSIAFRTAGAFSFGMPASFSRRNSRLRSLSVVSGAGSTSVPPPAEGVGGGVRFESPSNSSLRPDDDTSSEASIGSLPNAATLALDTHGDATDSETRMPPSEGGGGTHRHTHTRKGSSKITVGGHAATFLPTADFNASPITAGGDGVFSWVSAAVPSSIRISSAGSKNGVGGGGAGGAGSRRASRATDPSATADDDASSSPLTHRPRLLSASGRDGSRSPSGSQQGSSREVEAGSPTHISGRRASVSPGGLQGGEFRRGSSWGGSRKMSWAVEADRKRKNSRKGSSCQPSGSFLDPESNVLLRRRSSMHQPPVATPWDSRGAKPKKGEMDLHFDSDSSSCSSGCATRSSLHSLLQPPPPDGPCVMFISISLPRIDAADEEGPRKDTSSSPTKGGLGEPSERMALSASHVARSNGMAATPSAAASGTPPARGGVQQLFPPVGGATATHSSPSRLPPSSPKGRKAQDRLQKSLETQPSAVALTATELPQVVVKAECTTSVPSVVTAAVAMAPYPAFLLGDYSGCLRALAVPPHGRAGSLVGLGSRTLERAANAKASTSMSLAIAAKEGCGGYAAGSGDGDHDDSGRLSPKPSAARLTRRGTVTRGMHAPTSHPDGKLAVVSLEWSFPYTAYSSDCSGTVACWDLAAVIFDVPLVALRHASEATASARFQDVVNMALSAKNPARKQAAAAAAAALQSTVEGADGGLASGEGGDGVVTGRSGGLVAIAELRSWRAHVGATVSLASVYPQALITAGTDHVVSIWSTRDVHGVLLQLKQGRSPAVVDRECRFTPAPLRQRVMYVRRALAAANVLRAQRDTAPPSSMWQSVKTRLLKSATKTVDVLEGSRDAKSTVGAAAASSLVSLGGIVGASDAAGASSPKSVRMREVSHEGGTGSILPTLRTSGLSATNYVRMQGALDERTHSAKTVSALLSSALKAARASIGVVSDGPKRVLLGDFEAEDPRLTSNTRAENVTDDEQVAAMKAVLDEASSDPLRKSAAAARQWRDLSTADALASRACRAVRVDGSAATAMRLTPSVFSAGAVARPSTHAGYSKPDAAVSGVEAALRAAGVPEETLLAARLARQHRQLAAQKRPTTATRTTPPTIPSRGVTVPPPRSLSATVPRRERNLTDLLVLGTDTVA